MELKPSPSKKDKKNIKILNSMRSQVQSPEPVNQATVACWWGSLEYPGQATKLNSPNCKLVRDFLEKTKWAVPEEQHSIQADAWYAHSHKYIHTRVHKTLQSQKTQIRGYKKLDCYRAKLSWAIFHP